MYIDYYIWLLTLYTVADMNYRRSGALFLLKSIINVDRNDEVHKIINNLTKLKNRKKHPVKVKNLDTLIDLLGMKICPLDAESIISW